MKYLISALMVFAGIKGLTSTDGLMSLISLIVFTAGLATSMYGVYELKGKGEIL